MDVLLPRLTWRYRNDGPAYNVPYEVKIALGDASDDLGDTEAWSHVWLHTVAAGGPAGRALDGTTEWRLGIAVRRAWTLRAPALGE